MTAKIIWEYFRSRGLTPEGTAALMGNLQAESDLNPRALECAYQRKVGHNNDSYTAAVDDGSYTNFTRDGAGYGLACWVFHARKQALLSFAQSTGRSIGDLEMQLDFILKELQESYHSVLELLSKTTDIKAASDFVLTQFECPPDQSPAAKQTRANFGQNWYTTSAAPAASSASASPQIRE